MYKIYAIRCGNRLVNIQAVSKKDALEHYRLQNKNMGTPKIIGFFRSKLIDDTIAMSGQFYDRYFCS